MPGSGAQGLLLPRLASRSHRAPWPPAHLSQEAREASPTLRLVGGPGFTLYASHTQGLLPRLCEGHHLSSCDLPCGGQNSFPS